MAKIIIYPNNTAEIDGRPAIISLVEHGIDVIRNGINHPLDKECEKFKKNGNEYVVFFTMHRNSQLIRIKRRGIKNPFKQLIIRRSNETRSSNRC
jgi:hypothetical protein